MTTVEATDWLMQLGQDIARADANSLHAVRAKLAEVAGDDPDAAVADVVEQLRVLRGRITAVARQIFAARMEAAGPACSSALAWASRACDDASRLQAALVELARRFSKPTTRWLRNQFCCGRQIWLCIERRAPLLQQYTMLVVRLRQVQPSRGK